jgi:methionyl-tRNA formyltransferase
LWKAFHLWPGIYSFYQGKKLEFTQIDFEENSSCLDDGFEVWDVVEYEDHGETHIAALTFDWLLILEKVKLEWKKEMNILDFVNGNKNFLEYNFVSWK